MADLQSNVVGKCRIRATSRIPQVSPFANDVSFAAAGRSVKSAMRRLNLKDDKVATREVIYCITPDASFRLARTDLQAKFDVQSLGDPGDNLGAKFDSVFGRFLAAPYAMYGTRFADQMNGKAFKIVDVKPVPAGDRQKLNVAYETSGEGFSNRGSVVCDPQRSWAFQSGVGSQHQPLKNKIYVQCQI